MKRIFNILAILALALTTSCFGDKQMDAMNQFMDTQNLPGIYRDSKSEFVYDEAAHQCYINPNANIFCIMNDDATKYLQFQLSAAPVVGEFVDVETKSYGMGISSSSTYKGLRVDKIENGLCYLRSDAEGGYVGIIIDWVE